jgi:hypothetical protein
MKNSEIWNVQFPVQIEVSRENLDDNEPLGLSAESIFKFNKSLAQFFVDAMLKTLEEGIVPKTVRFEGYFKISGVERKK